MTKKEAPEIENSGIDTQDIDWKDKDAYGKETAEISDNQLKKWEDRIRPKRTEAELPEDDPYKVGFNIDIPGQDRLQCYTRAFSNKTEAQDAREQLRDAENIHSTSLERL